MANDSLVSSGFLEGFLRIMVIALIVILIAIPACIILDLIGIL
jgi:hypothetical protein